MPEQHPQTSQVEDIEWPVVSPPHNSGPSGAQAPSQRFEELMVRVSGATVPSDLDGVAHDLVMATTRGEVTLQEHRLVLDQLMVQRNGLLGSLALTGVVTVSGSSGGSAPSARRPTTTNGQYFDRQMAAAGERPYPV